MVSGIIATALFLTVIAYIGVRQLCDALRHQGVAIPPWARVALLVLVVLLFMLVPLGAPSVSAWR